MSARSGILKSVNESSLFSMEYAVKNYILRTSWKNPLSRVHYLCASCEVNMEAGLMLSLSTRREGDHVGAGVRSR